MSNGTQFISLNELSQRKKLYRRILAVAKAKLDLDFAKERAKIVDMDNMKEPAFVVGESEIAPSPKPVNKRARSVTQDVKTNVKNSKALMYEKQESRRAPKVQIDQKLVLWAWILGIGIAFISSAIVSFNGITSVATFVGLSQEWMAGLFFFFIELMYLLYLVAYLVLGSRVDEEGNPEKTRGALWGMIAFGGIAVLANAFHTLDFWEYAWTSPQMWAGIVLSVSAPIAIISASKMASRVVFAKAIKM
jgi:hypothetical protein